ncbi:hypothetical protein D3C87_1491630 [compost metagenome]
MPLLARTPFIETYCNCELITSLGLTFSKYKRLSAELKFTVELIKGLYPFFRYNEADPFKTTFDFVKAATFVLPEIVVVSSEGLIIFSGA